jgi:outer membrane immunogenic protein
MKSLIIAAVAVAGAAVAAPAFAQTTDQLQPYVNLGYTYLNPYNRDLGEITGRIGLRVWRFVGVEAEIGGGVVSNNFSTPAGNHVKLSEGTSAAGYVVGFFPVWRDKIDLLARVGYGETPLTAQSAGSLTSINTIHSINYGAGAQYALDTKNGVRFDYTRRDFQDSTPFAPKDVNTYSLAYVHKF